MASTCSPRRRTRRRGFGHSQTAASSARFRATGAAFVTSACATPDGQHVLTASRDNMARLWSLADGSLVRVFEGHTGSVTSACVTPDGQHVLTASWDNTARLWPLRA